MGAGSITSLLQAMRNPCGDDGCHMQWVTKDGVTRGAAAVKLGNMIEFDAQPQ